MVVGGGAPPVNIHRPAVDRIAAGKTAVGNQQCGVIGDQGPVGPAGVFNGHRPARTHNRVVPDSRHDHLIIRVGRANDFVVYNCPGSNS